MSTPNRSRRERPAKPALSREGIIAATIEIVRAEGLEKATMRRVAQALDTGPSALYVYVANTAELHGGVLDELVRTLEVAPDGDWQDRLVTLLRDYADVLFAFPGLARSALVLRPSGPNSLRIFDRVLGLLIDGGADPARAAWGADLLLQNATAAAAEHSTPSPSDIDASVDDEAAWEGLVRAVRTADPKELPSIAEHADAILAGAPTERMTWSIRALIAGIAATPTSLTHHELP
ncbi:TetR family transcriptional regulator [Rhodococcus sp. MS16]|uniref:TetR/AcrR family transcriptional regulator n=1 Tax=Rhodococcus sp. MS16 TaxID=2579941 RepID=UPI0015627969|nr:TetR/AcrR family transcriptional regulator C-terminal domain-containing protein [Rhodococcus sp. MS16]NRI64313.1 TetR family transcriptional regulator [Rhodococcus sp. MS16]